MKTKVLLFMFVVMTNVIMTRAAIVNGTCGNNLTWEVNTKDSTLIIEGSGVLTNCSWKNYHQYIKTVTFPEELTSINVYLDGVPNASTLIWNPRNCTHITSYSGVNLSPFPFPKSFKKITFGENVESIPSRLCNGMTNLSAITCISDIPPVLTNDVFNESHFSVVHLFVKEDKIEQYSNALWWEEFFIRPIGYFIAKFVDWDGEVLSSNFIKEGQPAVAPEIQPRVGYTFIGWDKPYNNITEDITITALYKINRYLVQFVDWDGSIIKEDSVNYGNSASAPTPSRQGYTFIGWDKDFSNIIEDLNVMAQYRINIYKVEFVDWNGNVLQSDSITYGEPIIAPINPQREGYTFISWNKVFSIAQENIRITAQYKINRFLVQFVDWDETVLKSDSVNYGYSAFAPTNPTRYGYKFTSWDKNFSYITADLRITAQYELIGYTVIFLDYNSTVLNEQFVKENESAIEPEAPYREGYNFIGWNIEYDHIIAPTFVIATYEKIETDTLLVVFKDDLNNIVSSQNIVCTIPNAPVRDNKQFIGWYIGETLLEDTLVVQAKYDEGQGMSIPQSNNHAVHKEIREGKVYIIRDNKTYTLQGQEVK